LPDVRPSHVSPAELSAGGGALRLVVAALLALTLAAAGCGGADPGVIEVPGDPATATIPDSPLAPAASSGDGASADATPTPTPTPTETPTAGTTGSTGTTGSSGTTAASGTTPAAGTDGGGSAAPADGTDGPANDTPPPAGSDAQKFEDFCAQNPGAC
jgi:hypothetical protein